MRSEVIELQTGTRRFTDVTQSLNDFCSSEGDGLVHAFVPHATAGLAIMETGSGSEADLSGVLDSVFPRDDRWSHSHGSHGHGADHVVPAFVAPSITVPVIGGRPQLGTWQSLVLVDTNVDNPTRKLRLSFLPA